MNERYLLNSPHYICDKRIIRRSVAIPETSSSRKPQTRHPGKRISLIRDPYSPNPQRHPMTTRPNFMKIIPIVRELCKHDDVFGWSMVHTSPYYDYGMNGVFFQELSIPEPNFHMGAGGGSHAEQTDRIMVAFEKYCEEQKPDLVMVVGDVNSTLACSIVAKKLNIKVAHVEAGLRSGDMQMPEEINRMVTDSISNLFFVTEQSSAENLRREGHLKGHIYFVGHVMIDNLYYQFALRIQIFPKCSRSNS